eukprot:8315300-Pyramimonas_sp.AAC.2
MPLQSIPLWTPSRPPLDPLELAHHIAPLLEVHRHSRDAALAGELHRLVSQHLALPHLHIQYIPYYIPKGLWGVECILAAIGTGGP